MSTLITDDLVEAVCDTIRCGFAGKRSTQEIARAALAVAVPEIGRACAEIAADYEPEATSSKDWWNGAATAADEIDSAIRSLTKVTP